MSRVYKTKISNTIKIIIVSEILIWPGGLVNSINSFVFSPLLSLNDTKIIQKMGWIK